MFLSKLPEGSFSTSLQNLVIEMRESARARLPDARSLTSNLAQSITTSRTRRAGTSLSPVRRLARLRRGARG